MTTLLVVSVVVLFLLVAFQGLVLLELVRQVSQIRKQGNLDDRPIPISLGQLAGQPLPEPARAVWSENGALRDGVLVLLSVDCLTCRLVAAGLREALNRFEHLRIVPVLQARNHDETVEMLTEAGLTRDEVVVDLESEYGPAFGIEVLPAAVVVRDGKVTEGAAVRNARQLHELLETLESPTRKGVHASESSVVSAPT